MAILWEQWVDGFDSTAAEAGCTATVDTAAAAPDTNKLTATIASAADTGDQAEGLVTTAAKLPAGSEGRVRFKMRTPASFDLLGNSTVFAVYNAALNSIIELYLTSTEVLSVFYQAGILNAGGGTVASSQTLAADTEYTIEVSWRKNDAWRVWVDGVLVASATGLASSTGDAVATKVIYGIDHYDGADANGWTNIIRWAQIADAADTALVDPSVPSTIAGGLAAAPTAARGGQLASVSNTNVQGGLASAPVTAHGGHPNNVGAATISADRLLNPGPSFARLLWDTVYGDHQEAYFTVDAGDGWNEWDIFLRFDVATNSGYMVEYEDDTLNANVYRLDNGSFTQIKSIHLGANLQAGDRFGFDATGSTLTVYVNGVAAGSINDSTYTQGQIGVGLSSGHALDDFGGGGDSVPGSTGTLGNTAAGSTWRTPGPPAENALKKITVPAGKTYRITSMNVYGRGNATAGTANWKYLVFDATGAGGKPGTVFAIVGVVDVVGGAAPDPSGWKQVVPAGNVDLPGGASGTDYWLGGIWGGTASGDYAATGAGEAYYATDEAYTYDTVAVGDAFGTPNSDAFDFSAYIEWEDVTPVAPRVHGGRALASATAEGGTLTGGTHKIFGGLARANATAGGGALAGGSTPQPANATREWGFALVDLNGVTKAVIDPSGVAVTVQECDYCTAKGVLLTTDDLAAYLNPADVALKVYVDGELRFHGKIAEPLQAGAEVTNFVAADPWYFVGRRLIQKNADGTQLSFTAQDAGAVLWALVQQQEARQPTHLEEGTITASVNVTGTYQDGQAVSEAGSALSQMEGGPFFRVDPVDGVAGTLGKLNASPTAGLTLENVRLEYGEDTLGNIADDFQVQYAIPATAIRATGGTDANGVQLTSYAEAAQAVLDQYGLNEKPLSFPDVTDQAHLDALAQAHVQTVPPATYTVNTMWTGGDVWVPRMWAEFDRGDTIRLRIRHGWLDVDALVRVNGGTVELDDESRQERITGLVLEAV